MTISSFEAGGDRADLHRVHRSSHHPVFLATAGVYLVLLGITVAVVRASTGGFTLALDDPYIHLALAENLRDHGTFGLEPGVYESASSAPLYTVVVAAAGLAPVPGPLLLLGIGALGSLWILWNLTAPPVLERLGVRPVLVAGLLALPVTVGLVPLTFTGMEHTVHAALVLQVLVLLPALVEGRASASARCWYYVLLAVGGLVRFETPFVAAGCALALVATAPVATDGRWWSWCRLRPAVATVGAAALPILAFSTINLAFGQYAVPNSVAAKTAFGEGRILPDLAAAATRAQRDRLLIVLLVLCVAALVLTVRAGRRGLAGALIALVGAAGLHLLFANVGWFDRYQAYLVVAAVGLLLAVAASDVLPRRGWMAATVGGLLLVLAAPRLVLLTEVPGAAADIHDQQEQMAFFFARHYGGDAVAVNDLGAVAWRHDGPIVDLAGLGSFTVLEASKKGTAGPDFLEQLASERDVRAVATYYRLFGGAIPPSWVVVESWCLTGPLVSAADDCVTFLAPNATDAARLRHALDEFDPLLPDRVEVIDGLPPGTPR